MSGRRGSEIVLVGASKRQPVEKLQAAWDAGLRTFGENRVQEAEAKRGQLPSQAEWHLIGPLQSNKAKRAAATFDLVESVDRLSIAVALDRHAGELGRVLPCFAQVNLGEEPTKHGFRPTEVLAALEALANLHHLEVGGLMAIPPPSIEPEGSRRWFGMMRDFRERAASEGLLQPSSALSMGMSADFAVAIEEGATHVRVGTGIFGTRPA